MTWLLPYSLLNKKWGKLHRSFSMFDLSIGLFVPFFLATGCVVIASASQFHGQTGDVDPAPALPHSPNWPSPSRRAQYSRPGIGSHLGQARQFPARYHTRAPGRQSGFPNYIRPWVLGMAVSTIIILMLINGLAFQELLGKRGDKGPTTSAARYPESRDSQDRLFGREPQRQL